MSAANPAGSPEVPMFPTFGPDVGGSFDPTLMTVLQSAVPQNANAGVTASGCDFNAASGKCVAIQEVGTVSGTSPTLDGKIQESTDNSTWTDVAGGAFTQVTASNNLQFIVFTRTKRYLRYLGTVGGTPMTLNMSCVLLETNA